MAFLILALILLFPFLGQCEFIPQEGIIEQKLQFVAVSPFDDNLIYLAGGDSVFKKTEQGWKLIYKLSNGNINFIYPSRYEASLLYTASDKGLLITRDGEHFEYIFQARSKEANCLTVAEFKDKIYLGTTDGLYCALSGIYDFKKVNKLPRDFQVYWLDSKGDLFYIAGNLGVFFTQDGIDFSWVYRLSPLDELQKEEEEIEEGRFEPTVVWIDYTNYNRVFLGTENGLFISNNGRDFKRKYVSGLPQCRINHIYQDKNSPQIIYLATEKGFYKYHPESNLAIEVKDGFPASVVNCIAIDNKGKIYLATEKGLFVEGPDGKELLALKYQKYLGPEPSFREVQEAAMKYNEVEPEKIRAWRRRLKLRAIMPSVDVGYDKTISAYSGGKFYVGPRDWSLDLSWDLGNLIWNNYEDDVDTRSRLNTQLRLDILEDVNHLYFERKRVRLELLNNPPKDRAEYLKKLLYLEELTAALDGYTGGYFSRRLQELQSQNATK
jgi:hypothetical protein